MCLQAWAELVAHVTRSRITVSFQSVSKQVRRNFLVVYDPTHHVLLGPNHHLAGAQKSRVRIARSRYAAPCWQVSFPIGQCTVVITPPRADRELPRRLLPPSYLHPLLLNPLVSRILRIHLLLGYLRKCPGRTTLCARKLFL